MAAFLANFTIDHASDVEIATEKRSKIVASIKRVKEFFDPDIENAHKTHKGLCAKKREALAPREDAIKVIDGMIGAFHLEQRRKREAREQEEEQKRLEAERVALAAQKELEAAQDETDRHIAAAKAADAEDQLKAAEDRQLQTHVLHDQVPATPKTKGVSVKTTYKWRVTDLKQVPRQYLRCEPNVALLNATVKASKMATNIPGIEVYEAADVRTTRKATT
jgi:hypothetical protein